MNRYVRIAAIVLGAFALGVVLVIGWRAVVAEVADLNDRIRRARCTWVDPLVVSVAGHELSLRATPETTVYTGETWLGGEEVTGYRVEPLSHGFCLDGPPPGPIPVRAVTIGFDSARGLAERAGLPLVGHQVLEIAEAGMFLPSAPPAIGRAGELVVYGREPEYGWPRLVSEGVGRDGFRTGAVCREAGDGWLCDVSALDTPAGLAYRFSGLPVRVEALIAGGLSGSLRRIAEGMRAVVALLEAEALAQR